MICWSLQREACSEQSMLLRFAISKLLILKNSVNYGSNHAEIQCVNKYIHKYGKKDLHKITLVVIRNQGGELGESKPCKFCLDYIKKMGIKKLIYSTQNGLKKENVNLMNSDHIPKSKKYTHPK